MNLNGHDFVLSFVSRVVEMTFLARERERESERTCDVENECFAFVV
jgi:hypothetical protein